MILAKRTALLAALLAMLAGCDPQRIEKLEEGVSTEVDVRKQFGDPVTVTAEADGSRTMDYPRQPEGWTNYVIKIGPDGKMSSLRQLLTPDSFARIQAITNAPTEYLVGAGNGLRENAVLAEMVAAQFGLPLAVTSHREEAAYGAALVASVGAGVWPDLAAAGHLIQ